MTYNKINLMIPTYKRWNSGLPKVIDSSLRTASNTDHIVFSFCVNEKDLGTVEYLENRYWHNDRAYDITFENTRQPNLSKYWNLLYDETRFQEENILVSMIGDDMVFTTPGWDQTILDEVNRHDGKAIVHCEDALISHGACAVNMFTTRKMVEATNKPFMCPLFHADMIDVIWTDVGEMTGTIYFLRNVVIRHEHQTKKANIDEWDETCKRLSPIQKVCSTEDNRKLARVYATVCAKNLVTGGIGSWNVI